MGYLKKGLYSIFLLCCILITSNVFAQQQIKPITGTVVDIKGEPLVGVSIMVKGTTLGTTTDLNGKFSLSANVENPVLQVSYIGFSTRDVKVTGTGPLRIVLSESIEALNEVVVVGYGSQHRKDLTGSIAVVQPKDLTSTPVSSVGDALEGRAAGVQIISSGVPGNDPTFLIRGVGTVNDASPLFVINGVPVSSGIGQLNMNDIASIQVLKDASATAIYGSRGANGVIIITTKQGEAGKPSINVNYFFGIQEAAKMIPMLNAEQYATLDNEMMANAGMAQNPAFANPASFGKGTNWLGSLFTQAPENNMSLSYSGGSKTSNYYVSANYIDQKGIVINTGYKKLTLQLNSNSDIRKNLKFGNAITLSYNHNYSGNYNIQDALLALPVRPIYAPDGTYSGPGGQSIWYGNIVNPVGMAKTVDNTTDGYNIIGSIFGELEIINGLKLKSTVGLQGNFWNTRTWAPAYQWGSSSNPNAELNEQYNKSITWNWDNTLTYVKEFGKNNITAMIGTSAQENNYHFLNGSVQSFASDLTQQMANGTSNPTVGGDASSWSLLSYMGRINYNYADKYLLTATLRRDGSSRFGSGNKWGMFPSVSAAWRISKENFFKDVTFVNDLKIRAGWGITGNQNIGNYSFAAALQTYAYNFNNTPVSAVVPEIMPNPNIQWEEQKQADIGIDASLFNGRINFTLDGYVKNTDKMLVPMAVPITTGYSDVTVPYINAGKMQNKGWEFTINTNNLTGKFKWSTSVTVSYNQNKVVSINDTVPMPTGSIGLNYYLALIQAGVPINEFYGYVADGIFQTQADVNNHALQTPGNDPYNRTSPGDIRYLDLNNDGVINDKDRTFLGNPNPRFIFSMNNNFSYQGFDLSVFLQGVSGNKILNANRLYDESMYTSFNQTTAVLGRWTGPGTSNTMPRAVYNDPNNNSRPSSRYIEDGSYLRIKNVTFSYTIPKKDLKLLYLNSARVYVSVENLYTFTKYSGFDPEVGVTGIDNSVYPVSRTFSVGVNLGL
ncbi:MAG: TonB-dependent receptor [Bacteroidales bacterium]|nr:TonB-dependent receptor [Bacteroidales bacterium]